MTARSRLLLTLLAGTAIALLPAAASAHNFSGASGSFGCSNNMTDNRDHWFSYASLTSASTAAVDWSRRYNYNPTDLNTFTESRRTAQTDVVVFDSDYEGTTCGARWLASPTRGNGTIGMALCQSLSGERCQQFFVFFDTDYMGPASRGDEASLACHELGHTVGLLHATGSCLASPTNGSPWLNDHGRTHINRTY